MSAVWLALLLAGGQAHDMGSMPGMAMPAGKPVRSRPAKRRSAAKKPPAGRPAAMPGMAMESAPADACTPEHAAMGHCPLPDAGPDVAATAAPAGTDQPAGDAPAPAPPADRAADALYGAAAMAPADRQMRREHGGMRFNQVFFNLAEAQVRGGRDGYRWDGEGWFGGDIHRAVVRTEGEGSGRVETAEVQALYSRALDPYWNIQAGVRQDLGSAAKRRYAVVGVEGLAPYWFDVEGSVFLSDHGDVLARAEAWYDQRITQRLILQPRIELNLAAQDVPASRIGSGLSTAELGVRLRYEIAREFAPYAGISWERRIGESARLARAAGEDPGGLAAVIGVRAWF